MRDNIPYVELKRRELIEVKKVKFYATQVQFLHIFLHSLFLSFLSKTKRPKLIMPLSFATF